MCVMCDVKEEKIEHFMKWTEYGNTDDTINLNDIYTQDKTTISKLQKMQKYA